MVALVEFAIKKCEKLKAENKRLREYVRHREDCPAYIIKKEADPNCTCGLDDLLKE